MSESIKILELFLGEHATSRIVALDKISDHRYTIIFHLVKLFGCDQNSTWKMLKNHWISELLNYFVKFGLIKLKNNIKLSVEDYFNELFDGYGGWEFDLENYYSEIRTRDNNTLVISNIDSESLRILIRSVIYCISQILVEYHFDRQSLRDQCDFIINDALINPDKYLKLNIPID